MLTGEAVFDVAQLSSLDMSIKAKLLQVRPHCPAGISSSAEQLKLLTICGKQLMSGYHFERHMEHPQHMLSIVCV